MYVTRRGRVVIVGVPRMDNWADSFHDGLVRVVRNKKYGFANRKGQIVISTNYDGAMNFERGTAKVCIRCGSKCADHDCEHHVFAGGEWLQINTKGNVAPVVRKNCIRLRSDRDAGTYLFGFPVLGNPKNQSCEQKILLSRTDPVPS
jgi:hypothetical protein